MNVKRNLAIQCLLAIFIPTGIYGYKRINKTKTGIQVYVLSFIIFVVLCSSPFIYSQVIYGDINTNPNMEISVFIFVMLGYIISGMIPILFIFVLTKRWNNQIEV